MKLDIFKRGQRGAALLYLVIGIVPCVAVMGLVVDYGEATICANKMQRAVDAAALAGASFLPGSNAQHKAEELAEANYGDYDNYDVIIDTDNVTVTMDRAVPTRFMRLFGRDIVPVAVHATAVKGLPLAEDTGNLMPFSMINPNGNDDPYDDLVPSNWGKEYLLFFGEDNIIVQDWANGDDPPPFNGGGNSMGWRGAMGLQLDGNYGPVGGANAFRQNFTEGWVGTSALDDVIPMKHGNMSGPTSQGREERLFGEEDELFDNFLPRRDYNMGRVVIVPIVSLLQNGSGTERFTVEMYDNGDTWDNQNVILDGFAPFWILTQEEQGDVDGDNNPNNDGDWVVGKYIPGTRAPDGSIGGSGGYGAITAPKLID